MKKEKLTKKGESDERLILPCNPRPFPPASVSTGTPLASFCQTDPSPEVPLSVARYHVKGTQMVLQHSPKLVHREPAAKVLLTPNLPAFPLSQTTQTSQRLLPLNFLIIGSIFPLELQKTSIKLSVESSSSPLPGRERRRKPPLPLEGKHAFALKLPSSKSSS